MQPRSIATPIVSEDARQRKWSQAVSGLAGHRRQHHPPLQQWTRAHQGWLNVLIWFRPTSHAVGLRRRSRRDLRRQARPLCVAGIVDQRVIAAVDEMPSSFPFTLPPVLATSLPLQLIDRFMRPPPAQSPGSPHTSHLPSANTDPN
jgi:hypothetical protein